MGEYFECELRLNSGETHVTNIWLRLLPRTGEYIATKLNHDGNVHEFIVKEIWHWAGDDKTAHKVVIYVEHA
ncbi:hypothetical protein EVU96_08875 [Bacillus infantis]|uniref:hypothetical protein n=1 Tax=Bacillus infantis TaxID=324767 RepID=UPI00101B6ECE|nr:hypothetical protein [Bacillus infantis]RYI30517.1 hypothetical protein EVU96_08875 [Bacillus infantis]